MRVRFSVQACLLVVLRLHKIHKRQGEKMDGGKNCSREGILRVLPSLVVHRAPD